MVQKFTPDANGIVSGPKATLGPKLTPGVGGVVRGVGSIPLKSGGNNARVPFGTKNDGIISRSDVINGNNG